MDSPSDVLQLMSLLGRAPIVLSRSHIWLLVCGATAAPSVRPEYCTFKPDKPKKTSETAPPSVRAGHAQDYTLWEILLICQWLKHVFRYRTGLCSHFITISAAFSFQKQPNDVYREDKNTHQGNKQIILHTNPIIILCNFDDSYLSAPLFIYLFIFKFISCWIVHWVQSQVSRLFSDDILVFCLFFCPLMAWNDGFVSDQIWNVV